MLDYSNPTKTTCKPRCHDRFAPGQSSLGLRSVLQSSVSKKLWLPKMSCSLLAFGVQKTVQEKHMKPQPNLFHTSVPVASLYVGTPHVGRHRPAVGATAFHVAAPPDGTLGNSRRRYKHIERISTINNCQFINPVLKRICYATLCAKQSKELG